MPAIANTQSIHAVVLNYNQARATLDCLKSLLGQTHALQGITVCDNASSDDSVATLKEFIGANTRRETQLELIANPANLGYAAGNNPGIRRALRSGADLVWIVNNDVVAHPRAAEAFAACAAEHGTAGIFGASIASAADPDHLECAAGCSYNPLTTVMRPCHAGRRTEEAATLPAPRLDYVSGACLVVRSRVFEQVGLLDERFFLYYEELDLCRRAGAAGFGLAWCRDARVLHQGGLSVGHASGNRERMAFANYHENLSTLLFTREHHGTLFPFACTFRLAGKAVLSLARGRPWLLAALWSAYRDYRRLMR